jgi:hypothetical protein
LVVTPVLAAAIGGGIAASGPAGAGTTWEDLRRCESGGDYGTDSGNGYFGAYQFSPETWHSLGYSGLPSTAAPAVQDEAALKLAKRSGFDQWPVCGQGMGPEDLADGASSSSHAKAEIDSVSATGSKDGSKDEADSTHESDSKYESDSTHESDSTYEAGSKYETDSKHKKGETYKADGRYGSTSKDPHFTTDLAGQVHEDVRSWQTRMNKLGYDIEVDGKYGPESAGAARWLQAAKGIPADGVCGKKTWAATFGK